MSTILYAVGHWSARFAWTTVAAWLLFIAICVGLAGSVGWSSFSNNFRVPGVESQDAADLLSEGFPEMDGGEGTLVLQHPDDPLIEHAETITSALDEVRDGQDVQSVEDPLSSDGQEGLLNESMDTMVVNIRYDVIADELSNTHFNELDELVEPIRDAGIQAEIGGPLAQFGDTEVSGTTAELIGIVAALIVLTLAFGSLVAAFIPIVTALAGIISGISIIAVLAGVVDIPQIAPIIGVMLGLGAGIDYALFIVVRFRDELLEDDGNVLAAARATRTAGHAVLFAGAAVVASMLGLFLTRIPFVAMMGMTASITVFVTMLCALTLLPAILKLLGPRINSLRLLPQRRTKDQNERQTGWKRWIGHIDRHPVLYILGCVALLVILALPVRSLELGLPDDGTKPEGNTAREAYDLVTDEFGAGLNGPLLVMVDNTDQETAQDVAVAAEGEDNVNTVLPPTPSPEDDSLFMIVVVPETGPGSSETSDLVDSLRDTARSEIEGSDAEALVGGHTATLIDMSQTIADRLIVFVLAVIGISVLLLAVMFRSILVPLKAAFVNILAVGAAFGVVVAIFQWGWGAELLGSQSGIPIVSFVPLFMFAILFGLSMDYEVFLMSKVREEYRGPGDEHRSLVNGISSTAKVITSAALIMICVFLAFVAQPELEVKMIAVGLATAVLLDATIIRLILVPAMMSLLGRSAWWLPAWLERLLPSSGSNGTSADPPSHIEENDDSVSVKSSR